MVTEGMGSSAHVEHDPCFDGGPGPVADQVKASEISLVDALSRLHLSRDQVTVCSLDDEVCLAPVAVPEVMQPEAAARPVPRKRALRDLAGTLADRDRHIGQFLG